MDPPACVQNAMMTKDKKPFTYTPGGIDLSEARSPRLQRRIERNANLGGVGDIPHNPAPHPPITGPLPPSALAAMRPQPQVQVFPSGPPPPAPMRGGAPPPPPPPKQGIPPPPPPPSCPLPTQKVQTSDNQVLERPDMTKIIPDNPMAMLRKTGGPQPRKSLVDQIFEESGKSAPEPRTPPVQSQQQFQPPQQRIQSGGTPISPVPQQTYKPSLPQQQQQYQPQAQPQYQQQQYQPPVQQTTPPREQYSRPSYPEPVKEQPRYQPPVIERQPSAPQNNGQQEVKTSTAHLGSLYIPPINQQQQKRIVSPPSPPERNLDSPGIQTPPLREAPRPWQTKKPQEEVPTWAKRENQIPNNVDEARKISPPASQQQQQRWPQPQAQGNPQPSFQQQQYEQPKYNQQQFQQAYASRPDATQHQQPIGIRIDIRTKPQAPYQDQTELENRPNVVYVTQPLVLQHPGAAPQRQQVPNNQGGARVVPVQVEGTRAGNERVLNRQQSWGSNPVQSNSFKIIQKFTNTDGEDEYDNVPITEHSPKYTQNFQQPVDQMRRMKLNDGEQSIANTFKQEMNFHDEENPRYRGGHIPSKVFKMLDESVPRGPQQQQSKGPQVRNIPIQIEGDDTPRPYVHPSEQVVPEPKKYTGSSIPSRSFKILQAMTAPNDYANVEEQNEETPYDEWVYPPHYPPYPYPPYWYDYYRYYYPESYPEETPNKKSTPRSSVSRSTSPAKSGRHTPLPYWGYMPPYCPSPNSTDSGKEMPPQKPIPPPWYGCDPYYPSEQDSTDVDESSISQEYLPYYDPYYYHYYYGYPPMYPPYPPRYANSDTDSTINGYSSLDEKGTKCKKVTENQKKVTNDSGPKAMLTPTLVVTEVVTKPMEEKIESTTDCETDTETDDEYSAHLQKNPLQSMKSITNIISLNTDSSDEDISKEETQEDDYSGESNDEIDDASSICYEDDAYPHQLSVIMEESERTESRIRSLSAMSDTTTLAERSDPEEDIVDYSKPESDESKRESTSDDYDKDNEEENIVYCSKPESDDSKQESTLNDYNKDNEEIQVEAYQVNDINVDDCEQDDDDIKSNDSEDWWGIIGKEDDDLPPPKKTQLFDNVNVEKNNIFNAHAASEDILESDNSDTEDIVSIKVSDVEHDRIDNLEIHEENTISKNSTDITNINKNTIQNYIEESNKNSSEVTNTNTNVTQNCNEESNYTEYTVVRRIKKKNNVVHTETEVKESSSRPQSIYQSLEDLQSEPKSRPRSIYESLEDIQAESTGSLIKVDNFVGILEQIQKETGFWNLNSRLNNEKANEPVKFRRTRSVEEKNLDAEKRFTWTSFENFNRESLDDLENKIKRLSCGSLEDLKINIKTQETVEGSTNYIKYNSSLSSTPVVETQIVTEDINDDNKSSTNESQTEESGDTSDSSASEKDDKETNNNLARFDDDADVKIPTIKDRIQALRESINSKRRLLSDDTKESSKDKISINDSTNRSKTASSKSSLKSFEEFSEEEEVDSGVTSDMSRHISDTEEFPELRKLTKYQRAATHSRLFKLLQEECNNEDAEDAEETKQPLDLNLNDAKTPVNERLVNELVDSLLKLKKGQAFKNLPKEKLYAAAVKILQEDMEVTDTLSGYSTSVQTPQEFGTNYDDYKQYYETWDRSEENFDIFPSKAFKVLQELSSNKPGGGLSSIIKCPKVLSSKNIHKKLIRLLENSENSSSPIPDKPPLDTNDVTRVS
ncbi:unnamed protein product [Diabrotica balteata]|uniref:Uncharacterized protein n=1 Tax=Diabrotica balteata TaxID=107213 RepID=A0A9P0E2Q3_DIABA|nr:unnamed protein product [Diabrotica balteata]